MDNQGFSRVIEDAFVPFLGRLGFLLDSRHVSGRLYEVTFSGSQHVVSISYEPGDDTFFVMIFTRNAGQLSAIDDRLKTPRLTDLNKRYMHLITTEERKKSEMEFKGVLAQDDGERQLLKFAKELR